MPRARSPNRDKAKELWIASGKTRLLKDIAAELGVPENRVRKWKSEDKWDADRFANSKGANGNVGKGNAPKRKRGAPKGNKNAVGNCGGAPKGNKNAYKHGCYSRILSQTLTADEQELFENGTEDVEALLQEQIDIFSVREYRFMKAIQEYKTGEKYKGGLAVSEVLTEKTTRDFGADKTIAERDKARYDEIIQEKIENGDRLPGTAVDVTTKTEATYAIIQSLERNLTDVQARKTKCIETLAKLRLERELSGKSRNSEAAEDWVNAVIATMEEPENE